MPGDELETVDVWLITGAQGSGKTTVADLVARSFHRGVHVRGGQFYRWVVSGWVHFDGPDQPEARRLLDLRYRLSAFSAVEYALAGFTCVVQDNIYGDDVVRWCGAVAADCPGAVRLVVLRPSVAVVADRDRTRQRATGKVAYRGGFTPAINDEHLAATPPIGLWLDTSTQTPEETVAEIKSRTAEALVASAPMA